MKELVENAIDAGSTAVTVEIEEGGISLIRITDNGCGIAKQDVENAFLRHSTSKIRSAEDLHIVLWISLPSVPQLILQLIQFVHGIHWRHMADIQFL